MCSPRRSTSMAKVAHDLGRQRLVDEVEARLPRLRHDLFHLVDQVLGGGRVVVADVAEVDVAEGALLPVAAVRHGQLVPPAVAANALVDVVGLERGEVIAQAIAGVVGRAGLLVRGVLVGAAIGVRDGAAGVAVEGALEVADVAHALEVLDDVEQRALAVVEREVVDVVEEARLARVAHRGVEEAAAGHHHGVLVPLLHPLADAQRPVEVAREGHREAHQVRPVRLEVLVDRLEEQLVEHVGRALQLPPHALEGGAEVHELVVEAVHQRDLEEGEDGLAHEGGDVVEVERRDVLAAVVQGQRVAGAVVPVVALGGLEVLAARQEVLVDQAIGERGVAPLQEADHRLDGGDVAVPQVVHAARLGRELAPHGHRGGEHPLEAATGKELEQRLQAEVGLIHLTAAPAQIARQVGGPWIGIVGCGKRRDHQQGPGRAHVQRHRGSR